MNFTFMLSWSGEKKEKKKEKLRKVPPPKSSMTG